MSAAHTPAWHAVPDALEVAGQWRPADLRGLPATLRYGATLSGVALAAARGRPRKVLLVDDAGAVVGADLEAAVDAVADALAAQVRHAGRREVAVCAGGHRGLVAAITATGALGLDTVLVPTSVGEQDLRTVLAAVDVVAVDPETAVDVAAAAPHAALVDVLAVGDRERGRSLRSVPRPRRPGQLRLLTSGTTGAPRTTHRGTVALGALATLLSLMHALEARRDEPVVVAPPLGHGHGLSVLTAALVVGAPAVLGQGRTGSALVDLVRAHGAGVLAVVPAQLAGLLDDLGPTGLPTVRRIAAGSAPLSADLAERCRRLLGDVLVDFYGSSEVGTATIATPEDLRDAPGTVGRPAAGVRVEVVDAGGAPVPTGVVGEVRVTSPWRATSTDDGQIAVGDLGHLDDQGRLFLDGRADDVAVVGGHNVPLPRLRAWFGAQPDVGEVTMRVLEHPTLGQQVEATVTGPADIEDLQARALAELGPALAPRRIVRSAP